MVVTIILLICLIAINILSAKLCYYNAFSKEMYNAFSKEVYNDKSSYGLILLGVLNIVYAVWNLLKIIYIIHLMIEY